MNVLIINVFQFKDIDCIYLVILLLNIPKNIIGTKNIEIRVTDSIIFDLIKSLAISRNQG